jgi:hypothetical protein
MAKKSANEMFANERSGHGPAIVASGEVPRGAVEPVLLRGAEGSEAGLGEVVAVFIGGAVESEAAGWSGCDEGADRVPIRMRPAAAGSATVAS